ncbi:transposase family protein [Moorena sp. SIO3I6]|uniref:transposase family protein n=1 Tax=Moorena sp. SIO3I6 TaxID=2607831 RepID=UPI0013F7B490|nr:transposase family protein [Moorena sp. SIO3I6]NEP27570.1 transposase family protein [Moorena sp. SIO3I6]
MVIGVIDNWVDLWNATAQQFFSRLKIPCARVPSYSAIRRVMINLDYEELQIVFNQWSKQYSIIPSNEWISLDGKSLKNTVSNYDRVA